MSLTHVFIRRFNSAESSQVAQAWKSNLWTWMRFLVMIWLGPLSLISRIDSIHTNGNLFWTNPSKQDLLTIPRPRATRVTLDAGSILCLVTWNPPILYGIFNQSLKRNLRSESLCSRVRKLRVRMLRAAPTCSSKATLTRRILSRLIRIIDALMDFVNSTTDLSSHTRSVTKTLRNSLSLLTIEIFWRVMISSAKSNSIWLKPLTTHALQSKEQILQSNIITIIWSNSTLGKISILSLKKKATASGSISSKEKKSPAKSSFKLISPPKARVSHAHLVPAENSQTRTHSYQIPLAECNSPWTLTKWLSN